MVFSQSYEKPSRLGYVLWMSPSTTIWSIGDEVSMSYFPTPTTQLYHHYLHFSIFKVGLFNQGLDAPLGLNPQTLESTHVSATVSFLIAKKCFVFILAPLMASHQVFGEGLQD
jgi:hypothetical protein